MKKALLSIFIFLFLFSSSVFAQELYNPQSLYDESGGLFDTDSLRTMSINFYENNYDEILDDSWFEQTGVRLPATVQMSNGVFLDSVAVRYKGNSTYFIAQDIGIPKVPLNLDMNDLVSGQNLMDYKKLKLSNALFDPTFCKEIIGYSIYRNYLPSPEANFIKVNLEENYLGLYVNTEAIDKHFLQKHFGENDGILFKCDPEGQFGDNNFDLSSNLEFLGNDTALYYPHYDLKSEYGWEELKRLTYIIENEPENLGDILNIDRVLWAFAVNMVIANLDTYNGLYVHNYYLYQTQDGLFQMIPWDVSESFVAALLGHSFNQDAIYEYDPFAGYNSWTRPLVSLLTSHPDSFYGKLYAAHIRTVLEQHLNPTAIQNFADELQSLAANAASSDPYKLFGMNDFYENVNETIGFPWQDPFAGIVSTATIRKEFLEQHEAIDRVTPDIVDVELAKNNDLIYIYAEVYNTESVDLQATISPYNSKFETAAMYDDGTNGDILANDNIFTASLPFQDSGTEIKYYVRAENEAAISLLPERAEYEFYVYLPTIETSVVEANKKSFLNVYPNPFSQETSFHYYLEKTEQVKITIEDNTGRMINTLVDDLQMQGKHKIVWQPQNLAKGVYFYTFQTANKIETGRLLVL
ncbi:MAG: CotH kinase family protein [Chitinophagales bacterium]